MGRNIMGKQRKISMLEGDDDAHDNTRGFNQGPPARAQRDHVATVLDSSAKYSPWNEECTLHPKRKQIRAHMPSSSE